MNPHVTLMGVANSQRVTVTLPEELVRRIDRLERNRSNFVARAVANEFARLMQEELLRSLDNPLEQAAELVDLGFEEWVIAADADDHDLLDPAVGKSVKWVRGEGWLEP